jgi:hypothetical protein
MLHKTLLACIAFVALLATSSQARAWGGYHYGYTHVGPYGAYHVGATGGYGGYGGYRGGAAYGGAAYGGYRYGGYPYGGYGGVRAGYVRRW